MRLSARTAEALEHAGLLRRSPWTRVLLMDGPSRGDCSRLGYADCMRCLPLVDVWTVFGPFPECADRARAIVRSWIRWFLLLSTCQRAGRCGPVRARPGQVQRRPGDPTPPGGSRAASDRLFRQGGPPDLLSLSQKSPQPGEGHPTPGRWKTVVCLQGLQWPHHAQPTIQPPAMVCDGSLNGSAELACLRSRQVLLPCRRRLHSILLRCIHGGGARE